MLASDVLQLPAMPPASPSYPRGPYRFVGREYLIITCESDPTAIRESLPEPLVLDDEPPIAGGPEIWGFPKKNAEPKLEVVHDITGSRT